MSAANTRNPSLGWLSAHERSDTRRRAPGYCAGVRSAIEIDVRFDGTTAAATDDRAPAGRASKGLRRNNRSNCGQLTVRRAMAGEGRPPTNCLSCTRPEVVGGRARPGHDTRVLCATGRSIYFAASLKGESRWSRPPSSVDQQWRAVAPDQDRPASNPCNTSGSVRQRSGGAVPEPLMRGDQALHVAPPGAIRVSGRRQHHLQDVQQLLGDSRSRPDRRHDGTLLGYPSDSRRAWVTGGSPPLPLCSRPISSSDWLTDCPVVPVVSVPPMWSSPSGATSTISRQSCRHCAAAAAAKQVTKAVWALPRMVE